MSRTRRTSPPPVARVEAHLGSERPSILVFVVEQSIAARLAGRARERSRAARAPFRPIAIPGKRCRRSSSPPRPARPRCAAARARPARARRAWGNACQRERGRRGGGVRAREDDAEAHRGQGRDMERFGRVTRAFRARTRWPHSAKSEARTMRVKPLRSASAHAFGSYDSGSTSRWNRRRPFAGDVSTALPASSSPSSYEHIPSSARAGRLDGSRSGPPRSSRAVDARAVSSSSCAARSSSRASASLSTLSTSSTSLSTSRRRLRPPAPPRRAVRRRESDARQLRHERALQLVLPRRVHASRNRAHRVSSRSTRVRAARAASPRRAARAPAPPGTPPRTPGSGWRRRDRGTTRARRGRARRRA